MYSRQDKNFMKDPATAAARIYVGNLDQKVVEDDLRTLFSPYGKILGISVQRNFGFIQFDSEASAALAIQKELGTVFKGKKLNVRGAITGEGGKGNNNLKNIKETIPSNSNNDSGNGNGSGVVNIDEQINIKDTSPINNINKQDQQQSNNNQLYPRRTSAPGDGLGLGPGSGPGRNNNITNNSYRDRSPLNHQHHNIHGHRQQQQQQHYHGPPPPSSQQQRSSYPFSNNNDNNLQQHINLMNKNKKADCNDCEIIVVAKSLTEYAEYIEDKLKQLGITVDLLFPNEDVPIGRVLANIASRGCLYAILVTPQNEQYHSLTLNILYGAPEEHRNMPTDDAINFIHKNFECYNNDTNPNKTNNIILNKLLIKHSDTIQILLNLLIQNRQLNVIQYDQLINYLQERRQLQLQYEQDTTTTIINDDNTEQANELQTRILNILNKTTTESINDNDMNNKKIDNTDNDKNVVLNDIVTSVISKITNKDKDNTTTSLLLSSSTTTASSSSLSTSTAVTTAPPPLLNDPSVQKALDSLLQADLLKNITINSNTNPTTNTTNTTTTSSTNDNINYGTNYSSNIRRF